MIRSIECFGEEQELYKYKCPEVNKPNHDPPASANSSLRGEKISTAKHGTEACPIVRNWNVMERIPTNRQYSNYDIDRKKPHL